MTKTANSIVALDQARKDIENNLERIQTGLKAFHRECKGNWAEYGSLAHWNDQLKELADSINGEGEYKL